ncbi:hypothetical protein [Streptomyces abyssalis]|uniref:hypothetical protein n=1 Tax=Streptomyces abyssalis TaxID=933944 RepID=UPI00085C4A2A|nr:hypothetical protein [Streptomyces abyssalis]
MTKETIRAAACAGVGCRDGAAGRPPRRTVAGSRLCVSCRKRLARDLESLPGLYAECALHLDGGSDRRRERTSGGPLPGMPFNAAAAEVRSSVLLVLAGWAGVVNQERGISPPPRAVAPMAAFLLRHAAWLAAHEAAGDLSEEITQLVHTARRVIDPDPARTVPVGDCVESGCGGTLTAAVGADRSGRPPAEIMCDADGEHRWTGRQWLQLSRLMAARTRGPAPDGPPAHPEQEEPVRWFSAAEIARLWNIPPGTVYRHASQQRWRRRKNSQSRAYYHDADVRRTLSPSPRTA